jgi:hypothetical protein
MLRKVSIAIAWFAIAATLGFVLWSSPSFQECNTNQQQTYAQASKENPPKLALATINHAALVLRCTGLFAYEYRDAITAIATAFIAAFTFTLWQSTKRMTQATGESVRIAERALADLERPYIYIFNPSGFELELNQEDPFYYFRYSVANYGKTPARIESAFVGMSAGAEPKQPRAVIGWDDFLVSPLFTSGKRRDKPTVSVPDEIKTIETADEFSQYTTFEGNDPVFLWAIIKYDGPFSKGHETSACWRWDETSRRLVLHEKHNYQK